MIEQLHEIRDIAAELQPEMYYHQKKKIARIIKITDDLLDHFTDDGR